MPKRNRFCADHLERLWQRRPKLHRLVRSSPALGVFDQALSSGNNFLTVILLGKLSGAAALGTYTLAFSVLILFQVITDALVAWPYTLRRLDAGVDPRRFAGSAVVHLGVLAAVVGSGALLGAQGAAIVAPERTEIGGTLAAMAALLPAFLLRHFARRFEFADENYGAAIRVDGGVLVAQFSGVVCLGVAGSLNSTTAILWIAAVNAVVGGVWLSVRAPRFALSQQILSDWRGNFQLGRWLIAGEIVGVVGAEFIFWLLAASQGVQATGIFSACYMVVLVINPLMLGVQSVLQPRCARVLREQNLAGLRREVARATAGLSWIVAVYFAVVAIFGGSLVATVYGGEEYRGQHWVTVLLAAQAVVTLAAMAAGCGLNAMQRTDAVFWAGLVRVALAFGLAFPLTLRFGLVGAATALLAGATVGAGLRIWAFLACSSPSPEAAFGSLPANSKGV